MQAKIIIVLIILSLLGLAGWYYKWSQAEIKVLRDNNTKLVQAKKLQDETIKTMKSDSLLSSNTLLEIDTKYRESRKENGVLRNKLAKHDLGYLASKKPRLIQKIVNKGTVDANRCLEILSGSALTDKEKAATKKSQANSSCPKIANPNYKARK